MAEIEIHVIAWPGQEVSAAMIHEELLESGYKATVIYALSGTEHSPVASDWVVLNGFGYGRIFEKSLSISESDVLLHVHADCSSLSWAEVAKRCHGLFESDATLGVWSPIVDWSSWNLSRTRLGGGLTPDTHSVTTVDGIVWAMSAPVIAKLKTLTYSSNPKGWGIDLAASAIAHNLGLAVVMDEAILIEHPRGSGYNHGDAGRESEDFAHQLEPEELELYRFSLAVARERIAIEKSTVKYKLGRLGSKFRTSYLDPLYRVFSGR